METSQSGFGRGHAIATSSRRDPQRGRCEYESLLWQSGPCCLGKTDIGRNPTPLANSFLVLQFDFSTVQVGSLSEIEERFWRNVQGAVGSFAVKYCALADWSKIKSASGPADCIDMVREVIRDNHLPPLYVIIDANVRTDIGWFRRLAGSPANALAKLRQYIERGEGEDILRSALSSKFGRAKFFSEEFFPYALAWTGGTGCRDRQSGARLQEGACPPPRLEPRDPRCRRRSVRQHRLQLVRPAVPLTGRNQGDGASND